MQTSWFVPITFCESIAGAPGGALTVIMIWFEFTVEGLAQPELDVSWHCIKSLFANVLSIYVELLMPTLLPFFFH